MSTATPLIEMHYLPCIAYIHQVSQYPNIIIEAHEHFIKQTYRNRCSIYGANGRQNLIIPVLKKSSKTPMKEVQISYEMNWQHTHFMAIHSAYKSSPYYDFYEEEIRALYSLKEKYLLDYTVRFFEWIMKVLKLDISISFTKEFAVANTHSIDIKNKISPKKAMLIQHPQYPQVFEAKHGFIPHLSVLDWIFNDLQGARSYYASS